MMEDRVNEFEIQRRVHCFRSLIGRRRRRHQDSFEVSPNRNGTSWSVRSDCDLDGAGQRLGRTNVRPSRSRSECGRRSQNGRVQGISQKMSIKRGQLRAALGGDLGADYYSGPLSSSPWGAKNRVSLCYLGFANAQVGVDPAAQVAHVQLLGAPHRTKLCGRHRAAQPLGRPNYLPREEKPYVTLL
jgi:hypothetical protein